MPSATPLDDTAAPVIALLSRRPFVWFTDVDGTLSPIVARAEDAEVPSRVRKLVERLARSVDHLVIVSGRAPARARAMVGVPSATYIGQHGLAWIEDGVERLDPEAEPYVRKAAEAEAMLRAALSLPGVSLENKGTVLALHYRQSLDSEAARTALLKAAGNAATSLGLRVHEGRRVVELRPPLARNKGAAVREVVQRHGIRGAVYVGDDVTDADAFRALRQLREAGEVRAVSVAVASPEADERVLGEADYRVEGVEGVERLLAAVVSALATGEIR